MESTTRINRTDEPGVASEQPTEVRPTVVAGGRELCSNCAAPLAADQRYCTECGQRHGAPRLPFMQGVAQQRRDVATLPPQPRLRMTANSTLIAGIGTLLLALGIGVLIGRTGNNSSGSRAAAPVQVVTVAGAGASGAAGASSAGGGNTTSTPSAASAAKGAATAKATHTSTKGTFTTKAPPPKVVTVGGSCTSGQSGCQGGKFTGNFFGQ